MTLLISKIVKYFLKLQHQLLNRKLNLVISTMIILKVVIKQILCYLKKWEISLKGTMKDNEIGILSTKEIWHIWTNIEQKLMKWVLLNQSNMQAWVNLNIDHIYFRQFGHVLLTKSQGTKQFLWKMWRHFISFIISPSIKSMLQIEQVVILLTSLFIG